MNISNDLKYCHICNAVLKKILPTMEALKCWHVMCYLFILRPFFFVYISQPFFSKFLHPLSFFFFKQFLIYF